MPASQPATRPIVGAIRWDAWYGGPGPCAAVEKSLGPKHFHDRLPFFAQVISDTEVRIAGDTQEIMDREIAYARGAGLDYWAFVLYPKDGPMYYGLRRYLASEHKNGLNFCLLVEGGRLASGGLAAWPEKVADYVSYFKQASYQTVLSGRPLFYIFASKGMVGEKLFASAEEARRAIEQLRQATREAGLPNPYIVLQGFNPAKDKAQLDQIGADALSAYAVPGGTIEGVPYAELTAKAHRFWDRCHDTGAQVVPIVSTGWDGRPRTENPVPWVPNPKPNYFQTPKPEELAGHLRDAIDWLAAHRAAAPSNAIIIYAWNENDEGGWLVPTLGEGTSRVDALGKVMSGR